MSAQQSTFEPISDPLNHPRCPTCNVAMWQVLIETSPAGKVRHFECMACQMRSAWREPQEVRI